jgi:hypothetical protein
MSSEVTRHHARCEREIVGCENDAKLRGIVELRTTRWTEMQDLVIGAEQERDIMAEGLGYTRN